MDYMSNVISIITAFIMFVSSIPFGGLQAATVPKNPEVYDDTVMFISDFQSSVSDFSGANREKSFAGILDGIDDVNPGLVVGGGDYQSMFVGRAGTAFGISLIRKMIAEKWDYNMEYLFAQGNHDTPKSRSLNNTGLYEFENYCVYLINEDDYPWNEHLDIGIAEKKVQQTAATLDESLSSLAENGDVRPVFIVSHLPLHYSSRSNGADNRYAGYIYDAISNNANSLNIVYLYGHNHSDTYDDYIGGAVNYLDKGDALNIGGTNEEKTLNFVYTNCGYSGYSNNTDNDTSSSELTATFIKVSSDGLRISKYSKDGLCMEKTVGAVSINVAA